MSNPVKTHTHVAINSIIVGSKKGPVEYRSGTQFTPPDEKTGKRLVEKGSARLVDPKKDIPQAAGDSDAAGDK